jgi:uncharacterized membrane protein (UPF0136 family)
VPTVHVVAAVLIALYGVISLAGGILGYVRAGSLPSLIAGGISGVVLLACAAGVLRLPVWSLAIAILVSLALVGRFAPALFKADTDFSSVRGLTAVVMAVGGIVVIAAAALAVFSESHPPTGT